MKMFMDERTSGQTTDGRQAHRYIPRTFRSGDKDYGSTRNAIFDKGAYFTLLTEFVQKLIRGSTPEPLVVCQICAS